VRGLKMKKKVIGLVIAGVIVGILIGYFSGSSGASKEVKSSPQLEEKSSWTCSMHPQIVKNKAGKCPICGMDLIPLKSSKASEKTAVLELDERARKLAEVQSSPVERKFATAKIGLFGKIEYDKTRFDKISAHFPGRIEKLFVNYTGMPVKKGSHIAELFSPDLSVLQKEFIIVSNSLKRAEKNGDAFEIEKAKNTLNSVRSKMRIWGFTTEQVKNMRNLKKVSDTITLYSPVNGIAIQKNVIEGQYFNKGDTLFTIADISRMWLIMDAYESELSLLRYGQKIEFETEAYPGRKFYGRIAYIYPEVDEKTRTVKIRASVENSEGKLKAGMLAKAEVMAKIGKNGELSDDSLAGKWVSPMHPEIIKDKPGVCDVCGMKLVPAESLGFISGKKIRPPLLIPKTAPLLTGKRAVVYIDKGNGKYEGREVELGPETEKYFVVLKGLKEGEKVVTKGNFKIDSAMQIHAKPSMMSLKNEKTERVMKKESNIKMPVNKLLELYFRIKTSLVNDNFADCKKSAKALAMESGVGKIHHMAMKIEKAENINKARECFSILTHEIYSLLKENGGNNKAVYVQSCPMAFNNKGDYWLSEKKEVDNPYFGSAMLHCGENKEMIQPEKD
jgi:Cu(I)/Ag(I) efflux system membrane fusion protein